MLKKFVIELFRYARARVITAFVLFLLSGVTQGVGLMMIIPLLSLLGLSGGEGRTGGVGAAIVRAFNGLGLPLNLLSLLVAYMGIVIFFALLNRCETVLNVEIQQGFIRFWRNRLYRTLTYADWLFIAREKSSEITHALTSDIQQIGSGTLLLLQISGSAVLILFHLAVAFMLSLPLTLLTLVFGAVMLIFIKPLNRAAFDTGKSFRSSRQALYSAVMEHLTGMKTAKSFGAENRHIERIEVINKEIEARVTGFARARANTRLYYEIAGVVFISVFFWVAVEVFRTPAVRLLVLAFIFTRLLPRFSTLQQQYQNIRNMLPAFSGAAELYNRAAAAREAGMETPGEEIPVNKAVSFRGVSFRYRRDSGQYALEKAEFDIPAHKITAIVGPSGAGKSTLADLLLGLLKPESGKILVDDAEITAERLVGWRHSIGYVPQESFLFHDTLRANLLWANPSANEEELWEALRLAAAEDFVKNLPKGLETVTGDRGITLSGGERQRIALARALLRKPRLLLLDEATSALDSQNEERIQQAVLSLQGKLTVVIIAHRFSTLRCADHIIVLEKGRVLETGTWETLGKNRESFLNHLVSAGTVRGEEGRGL